MRTSLAATIVAGLCGVVVGSMVRPGPASASRLTLYGHAPEGSTAGSVAVKAVFSDPATGEIVATRDVSAKVADGRFIAETEPLPDGLYALTIAPAGAAQTTTFVQLQTNTPGTQQTGNVNVSGTVLAGRIGIGIAPANARLQIEDPTDTQGLRVRTGGTALLAQSLATTGAGFGGQFTTASAGGRAIFGEATSTTGPTVAGLFRSRSSEGIGLTGQASSVTGSTVGVKGEATSPDGIGVVALSQGAGIVASGQTVGIQASSAGVGGNFTSTGGFDGISATTNGVSTTGAGGRFTANAIGGLGVLGVAGASTGASSGGEFRSASTSGRGAFGIATATTGPTIGVFGQVASTSGRGIVGLATALSGATRGGDFSTSSTGGTGVRGVANATTGTTLGGFFEVLSANGAAVSARSGNLTGGVAVRAVAAGSAGAAVTASVGNPTGTAVGIQSSVSSAAGTAITAFNTALSESVEIGGPTSALHVDGTPTVQSGNAVIPMMPVLMGRLSQNGSSQPTIVSSFGGFSASFLSNGGDDRIVIDPTVVQLNSDEIVLVTAYGGSQRAFTTVNASISDPADKITIRLRTFDGSTFNSMNIGFVVYDFSVPNLRPGGRPSRP